MTAFKKAYDKRNHPEGLMFHSDRGSQYTAFAFRQLLDTLNVVQSFSKKGYPCFYNFKRPHGSLGMLTPNQKEELFWNQA